MGNYGMNFKGITRRWYINVLAVVFLVLVGFEIIFSVIVYNYYYDSVGQHLKARAEITSRFFNKYSKTQYSEFYTGARQLVDDFTEKDKIELQIIDLDGKVLFSSNGFVPSVLVMTNDVKNAIWGNTENFIGKNSFSNENIMSVSSPLKDASGNIRGVARFVVSLTELDKYILLFISVSIVISIIIILLVFFSGRYFISSIVKPVSDITKTAKEIAKGELNIRIDKKYDDEIGELVDSINNMANEISKTDHLKNDFISSISHELRTPLTAIKGWSETMLSCDSKNDTETINKGLNIISEESQRLTIMVEELLDFSRMQNHGIQIDLQPIDVGSILIETIYIMKERARREGIIIEFSIKDELPVTIGDSNRLKQVFINVIDNAVKHSEKEGKIDVTAENDGEYIIIIINDYGCGIPLEFLPNVKQKFIKGPSSKSGSGLGLALADEIVKLHNGQINIESVEDKGTTVKIVLPIIEKESSDDQNKV